MRLPGFGSHAIGMDVDRGAIKAVQVGKSGDGYVLEHVGYHRLPEGVISDGDVADSELLSEELREFWDLHDFQGKSVVLGVAGGNVIVRFVPFPRLSDEDRKSALTFQAEEHIPMPIDDVVLDHVVLGPSGENPDEDLVLLVAAHRDLVSNYTASVRSGGLKPVGVDVKALALSRSALPEALFDDEDTTLLLDVGTEISNLLVVQGQTPTHVQFLNFGFRDFAHSVALAAELDDDEAEKQALGSSVNISPLVQDDREPELEFQETEPLYLPEVTPTSSREEEEEHDGESVAPEDGEEESTPDPEAPTEPIVGSGERSVEREPLPREGRSETGAEEPEDPALIYDVRRGLEEAAVRLASEVQRSIEFHNSRPGAREVSRLVLSGEGALIRGLDGFLGDYMGLPAGLARPTDRLVENRSNVSDEQLSQMEPVLAVAIGLALEE
ncbi:pilM: type IV pilus assembly protein PilM [Rubrobacter radiotolerans]|uniref:Type IV pilus assembly protein PilM n=1 Tax=Rubrobacter radiotolerans TaxID=42256 RepID=A0A023X422_RUBRA|nr:type IV pilus assembly protein PilM [Rubrobacter radiotolerans]AHY46755.1 pilM: type IV pilus assembly protein PilM [Rubrobacter radiotolerans]MDX5894162.1 type IV pilus assembly protein PilM [Rubrobacter radiotolerans]SMC05348.1 type IV pilus assembly protein PilM [Rubrobacter radiotolerans DSM 5868]